MILRLNLPIATLEEVVKGVVETIESMEAIETMEIIETMEKMTKNATITVRYLQKGRVHLLPSQEVVEDLWELLGRLVEKLC